MVWSNTSVYHSINLLFTIFVRISKQHGSSFQEKIEDKMTALPQMMGGLSVRVQVCAVRQALPLGEVSGSSTVAINISLEQLVSLAHTVACLVERTLLVKIMFRPIGNMVVLSGNRGTAASAALTVSPEGDEQDTLVSCITEGGDYSVGTDFCFRIPDLFGKLLVKPKPNPLSTQSSPHTSRRAKHIHIHISHTPPTPLITRTPLIPRTSAR